MDPIVKQNTSFSHVLKSKPSSSMWVQISRLTDDITCNMALTLNVSKISARVLNMPRWQWIICKNRLEFWRPFSWENGYPTFCGSYLTFMLLYEKRWASSVSWPQLPGLSFFSHKNTLIFITERPLLALCYSNFEKPRRSKDQSFRSLLFSRMFRSFSANARQETSF